MASATTVRPSGSMANPARPTRFPEFGAASGRQHSESSQPSTLGHTFGNGGAWQPSSGIWGSNAIGSGFSSSKRDASRSRGGDDDFPNGPSGSGALAASSEADPWVSRGGGPWNAPDTTSPTLQSHSGSTSPSHTRNILPNTAPQTLAEMQNQYQQAHPTIGRGASFSRTQPKSSLDPSSGPFKFGRQASFAYNEEKENPGHHGSADTYDIDMASRYLGIGNSASRESSIPPSRASDASLTGGGMPFGNSNIQFGSIGNHTPNSSIHSQRPSFSGPSGSYSVQLNGSRFDQADAELSEKLAGFALGREIDQSTTPQINSHMGTSFAPSSSDITAPTYAISGHPGMWGEESRSFNNQHSYSNQPFAEQTYFNKTPRFADRGAASPAGSDGRRSVNSPKYYSATGTPPVRSEQIYRPGSRGPRAPQGSNDLERRLQNVHYAQQTQAYLYGTQFQNQYPQPAYEYASATFRQPGLPYGYPIVMPGFSSNHIIPTRPAKDQDAGVGVRSVLLEEFRSSGKSNKRYELKDIYNHVVEFSGDQHGSRFIQQKLETANSDEKEQLFREIQPNALQLMTDVFGNYVIQKLFEHGNQVQKRVLAEQMRNHIMELSMQMYGCRVVQKALEHVLADQQAELVDELRADVLKCVKDQNGNHVVQKAIERVPTEHIQFIIEAFRGQVHVLAAHPYGCRVIQRILEYCKPHDQAHILQELHQCSTMLITDQYGNYVTQHVISHGKPEDRAKIIKIITAQLLTLSKHKFASNVVEKSIVHGSDEQRRAIVSQLTALNSDGTSPLQLMMKDQFGNYVIQKLLGQLKGAEREAFLEDMKPQLLQLKKYNYGKQIAAIEKLIYTGAQPFNTPPAAPSAPASHPIPIEITSNAPTPLLTDGQNSPQSSSLPSTSVSTIDDSPDTGKAVTSDGKPSCPEVVIHGI